MKLKYETLISPYPLRLNNIGNVKSPTLKEIWNPEVTYEKYQMYISLLLATPELYSDETRAAEENSQDTENMFDIITENINLQEMYSEMFSFFMVEDVVWSDRDNLFVTYNKKYPSEEIVPVGIIHRNVYSELCDIILQRCGISNDIQTDISAVKNRRSREIMKKLNAGRKSAAKGKNTDRDMELPNLITAIAVKSNSLNFANIWDLTVCQFYEHLRREQINVYFDIQKMSVAAYGNEKKTFTGNEWIKNEN